ncbi:GLPGLI family protein [uncultured Formosa sp.]|uniref:GLPGLI family protein n=1 Tax=uncultured Formosa sp. TaxID=255435 RepID=UPI00261E9CE2|nr:GLPGLI family protein [uncultured Formosa sp.]
MKSQLFKIFLVCLFTAFSCSTFAQADFQGKAYYESKTTAEMPDFGGRQMSDEQKKRIEERMKSLFEKTYILSFNRSESIYKEEEKLAAPSSSGGRGFRGPGDLSAGPKYKNIKTNQVIVDQEFFGKQFLIKDSLPKLVWKMQNESKQIGQYTCFKATAVKLVSGTDITSFRGPKRGEEEDKSKEEENVAPREVTVTAWYTPQIPVNQGPDDYWGLPGLILEVSTDKTTILCSKIVLNAKDDTEIKIPTKGKVVTQEEYTEIATKKMAELRESFSGRGPGGGGRR